MSESPSKPDDVLAFWNSRAGLGQWAGTRDVLGNRSPMDWGGSNPSDS